ncbi:MAG: acyltransferase [Rubrivivax sp.]|nr:MAG: acyltransferase [Rubrivivax sp.]
MSKLRHLRPLFVVVAPIAAAFLSIFFDRKYLRGRSFEQGFGGYVWALRSVWAKNMLRLARPMPWPTALTCYVSSSKNIEFHPDDLNNFQSPGTYFQNFSATIRIGKGSYIAPNVGLITANHRLDDLDAHEAGQDIILGEKCWIGMGAVILPGVHLGNCTIVAAGAVVNSSFPDGHVVIGGVPAKVLKHLSVQDPSSL